MRELLPPDLHYLRVSLDPERSGEEAMRGPLLAEEPRETSESGRMGGSKSGAQLPQVKREMLTVLMSQNWGFGRQVSGRRKGVCSGLNGVLPKLEPT